MTDYVVVDVRDDDWEGGNIKGARNEPSYGFLARVDALVQQTKDVPLVIFHCALSEVRYAHGFLSDYMLSLTPCMRMIEDLRLRECVDRRSSGTSPPHALLQIYAETRDNLQAKGQDSQHEVLILRGGFSDFQAKFKDDPDLVENWSKEVWGNPQWF